LNPESTLLVAAAVGVVMSALIIPVVYARTSIYSIIFAQFLFAKPMSFAVSLEAR
jgi:hypothetical protein